MNKPLVAVFAGLVSLIAAPASGESGDKASPFLFPPGDYPTRFGDPGYSEEMAAAKEAAIAKWNKMTPEEQAAAKKAARDRKAAREEWDKMAPEQQAAARKDAARKRRQEDLDMIGKPPMGDFWTPHPYPWQKAK